MKRFIEIIQLAHFKPVTYLVYANSESIIYFPEQERYRYDTANRLTFDYYEEIEDTSIDEHVKGFIEENELEYNNILVQEKSYSIFEVKFEGDFGLEHELILSIFAQDGFFMVRFLESSNDSIEMELRQNLIKQMKTAVSRMD